MPVLLTGGGTRGLHLRGMGSSPTCTYEFESSSMSNVRVIYRCVNTWSRVCYIVLCNTFEGVSIVIGKCLYKRFFFYFPVRMRLFCTCKIVTFSRCKN